MRRIALVALAPLLAAVAIGCGGSSSSDLDTFGMLGVTDQNVPEYEVLIGGTTAELLVDADPTGRKQAIADFMRDEIAGWDDGYAIVKTVPAADSPDVTCQLEYFGSDGAREAFAPGQTIDEYPALMLRYCD